MHSFHVSLATFALKKKSLDEMQVIITKIKILTFSMTLQSEIDCIDEADVEFCGEKLFVSDRTSATVGK